MIFRAIKFVAEAHEGHYRKGTKIPYITHLVNVMKTLVEVKADEEVVVAGLLHDVLEDTPVTPEEVERKFGKRVANLVNAASEPEELVNIADKKESWRKRKEHTINYILTSGFKDKLLVSCADKLDNARAILNDYEKIGDKLWDRFNAGKEEQKWYYTSLAEAFVKRGEEFGEPLKSLSVKLHTTVKKIFG